MADVKFEVVRFSLSTAAAGNTQDVTVSGTWTPKAAIFINTEATTDDTIAGGVRFGIGFTDGTSEAVVDVVESDAISTMSSARGHRTDRVITFTTTHPTTPTEVAGFSFNSWINTGGNCGVKLDIDDAISTGRLVTCILIGGDDVSNAHVGTLDDLGTGTSAVDIATVGFNPDLVFVITTGTATPMQALNTNAIFGFGVGHNDGSNTQRAINLSSVHNVTDEVSNSYIGNDSIIGQVYDDAQNWDAVIGSYDASGFSLTPSASAGSDIVSYLCLKFTNSPDIKLFDMQWPTSGNYAETTPAFTPSFGMIASSIGPSARNTVSAGAGISIAAFNSSTIYTATATTRDAQATAVAKSLSSDQLRILAVDGSTDAVLASSYAFDADGWDFTLTTNPVTNPVLGWALAIGVGGSATVIPNDATQGQSIDNVTLTQHNVLAVAALDQAQSLDNVTLTQAHIIAVNDLSQGQAIDNLALTQANVLAVADITQAQLIDALTLVQHNVISPNALDQAQGIDNLTLTVAGSLAVQALLQGQTIDNLTLTQAGTLSVADLTQAQLLDAAALTQHYVLAVADLLQSQLLDNVTLSLSGASLSIADMGQAQSLDASGLVQHAVISVNDLTQQQILDIATLGGLVIGELQGTIVVYALVGGEVRCYSALDGTITLH